MRGEGADVKTSFMLYLTVVQAIIINGFKIWVLNKPMLSALEGKHLGGY